MPDHETFKAFQARVCTAVDQYLEGLLQSHADLEVARVVQHVLCAGGHRWRPMFGISAGLVFSDAAFDICLPGVCSIELAHNASLLLDDLPSMDDAQFRHGNRCAHHVFPRWAVDMAPTFMITLAFDIALGNSLVPYDRRVEAIRILSRAGLLMVVGQEQDILQSPRPDSDEALLCCYTRKTAGLFAAAAKAAAIECGASESDAEALFEAGLNIGLAYQFLDDVTDVVARVDQVGKTTNRDGEKCTAVTLFGVDGTRRRAAELQKRALSAVDRFDDRADPFRLLLQIAGWALE